MKTTTRTSTKDSNGNTVVSKRNTTPTPRFFVVASLVVFISVALATLGMLVTVVGMFG